MTNRPGTDAGPAQSRTPDGHSRIYALALVVGVAFLCVTPALLGRLGGEGYLGLQYNTDDHMVYAAWMRQAMEGRFFFDNRFTIDPQPGLTVHVYFFVLGLIARVLGIVATMTLARATLSGLFVWLAYGLICRLTPQIFVRKLALTLTVFGAGAGFLVWHNFGVAIVKPVPPPLGTVMFGRLPIDVWQPEAFVFPSMLTNGLFMAALCLIVVAFRAVLDAKESRRAVPLGFCAFALLANIHSYDVAMMGLVLIAFLLAGLVRKQVGWSWFLRGAGIAAGAIGPALWIAHVLHADPVFRSRAATETFSPPFSQVFWGIPFLIALAIAGLWLQSGNRAPVPRTRAMGAALACILVLAMYVGSIHAGNGYWMSPATWAVAYLAMIATLCLIWCEDLTANLLWAWALVGLVAIYFPALFQRKMAMGLAVPWALLASLGLAAVIARLDRGSRNLVTVLAILLISGSSFDWLVRERAFAAHDESSTTLHPAYLSADARHIVDYLNEYASIHPTDKIVVVAMPGIRGQSDQIDGFAPPVMPDLNPILSGLTGVYTYAGHWSETPDYGSRRNDLMAFYVPALITTGKSTDPREFLRRSQADFIVAPVPGAFPQIGEALRDMRDYGRTVVDGSQFRLVKVD
jgi:arabinosyltransferase C